MHPLITAHLVEARRAQLWAEAESARLAAGAYAARRDLRLRALDAADSDHIAALFGRLSPRSRYLRYLAPVPRLSTASLRHLASIDHESHEAVGAFERSDLVGAAHYFRSVDDATQAEVCVEVADGHQRRGVGTWMLRELARLARARGINELTATALRENRAVLSLVDRLGLPAVIRPVGHELAIVVRLPGESPRGWPSAPAHL